jgi:hypothetical protein
MSFSARVERYSPLRSATAGPTRVSLKDASVSPIGGRDAPIRGSSQVRTPASGLVSCQSHCAQAKGWYRLSSRGNRTSGAPSEGLSPSRWATYCVATALPTTAIPAATAQASSGARDPPTGAGIAPFAVALRSTGKPPAANARRVPQTHGTLVPGVPACSERSVYSAAVKPGAKTVPFQRRFGRARAPSLRAQEIVLRHSRQR